MAKSRTLKRFKKSLKTMKRKMRKTLRRGRNKVSRSFKRGGLTCYDGQGWPDPKGYYDSKGRRNEDCPIQGYSSSSSGSDDDYNTRRGY